MNVHDSGRPARRRRGSDIQNAALEELRRNSIGVERLAEEALDALYKKHFQVVETICLELRRRGAKGAYVALEALMGLEPGDRAEDIRS